jgi:hypothetical protein
MRQIVSTAIVAVIVGAVAGATMSAVAQEDPATTTERTITPAGLNADKVDGKHAVRYTLNRNLRRNRLVATNRQGFLPPNIVRPGWNAIQGKPPTFADGQVDWTEVANKPADPVITITQQAQAWNFNTNGFKTIDVVCPTGKVIGGGFFDVNAPTNSGLVSSYPFSPTTWRLAINVVSQPETGTAYAMCMTGAPATVVARVTPAAKNPTGD